MWDRLAWKRVNTIIHQTCRFMWPVGEQQGQTVSRLLTIQHIPKFGISKLFRSIWKIVHIDQCLSFHANRWRIIRHSAVCRTANGAFAAMQLNICGVQRRQKPCGVQRWAYQRSILCEWSIFECGLLQRWQWRTAPSVSLPRNGTYRRHRLIRN